LTSAADHHWRLSRDSVDRVALDPATQITAHMLLERHKVELVPVSKDWVAAKAQVLLQSNDSCSGTW
jgi:hypothetical protein